jgi:small subunit ribosomal protein S13
MARIAGVELPSQKRVEIGLTYIYGIGRSLSNRILYEAGVNPDTRVKNLTESEISAIQTIIQQNFRVEGELRRTVQGNIRRLIDIGCYRGLRHRRGLPVRGQRTRTNARTKRGKRKTVGTVKREEKEKEGEG